jgi:hypothetical protein
MEASWVVVNVNHLAPCTRDAAGCRALRRAAPPIVAPIPQPRRFCAPIRRRVSGLHVRRRFGLVGGRCSPNQDRASLCVRDPQEGLQN